MPYFKEHPELTGLYEIPQDPYGRKIPYALLLGKKKDTVVFSGHFDVVSTEEYGKAEAWAYEPGQKLEEKMCIRDRFLIVGIVSFAGALIFENDTFNMDNIMLSAIPVLYAGLASCAVGYTFQIICLLYTSQLSESRYVRGRDSRHTCIP